LVPSLSVATNSETGTGLSETLYFGLAIQNEVYQGRWFAFPLTALLKYRISISKEIPVPMARVCDVCGRGPQFGHRISHAHNVTKRRWNLNLQTVRAVVNGATKRIRVCTSCIRSGKVQKAA